MHAWIYGKLCRVVFCLLAQGDADAMKKATIYVDEDEPQQGTHLRHDVTMRSSNMFGTFYCVIHRYTAFEVYQLTMTSCFRRGLRLRVARRSRAGRQVGDG